MVYIDVNITLRYNVSEGCDMPCHESYGGAKMPASKSQQKAVHKYVREKYDRINITVPKGRKAAIQAAGAAVGESLNGYVTRAVDERMERQGATTGGEDEPL